MCGRFTLRTKLNILLQQFAAESQFDIVPRYNIAPTQDIPVIRQMEQGRQLDSLRWGLVPPWADSPGKGAPLINAQAETVATKPTFRSIIKNSRCLVPADGFFEWEKVGTKRQPHYFGVKGFKPFAFAGLWQTWKKGDGEPLESCVILTTRANDLLAKLHDRMPVILSPNDYEVWLDPDKQDPSELEYLYEPYPANDMESFLVDPKVNNARNEGEDLIRPLDRAKTQTELPFSEGDTKNSQ